MCELCRRSFLGGAAAVATASVMPKAFAQGAVDNRFDRSAVTLPVRGEFVIANAYIITMDPQLGDVPNGSCTSAMALSLRLAQAQMRQAQR